MRRPSVVINATYIRTERTTRGWTQMDLAKALGREGRVPIDAIRRAEKGHGSIELAREIAAALQVDVKNLIVGLTNLSPDEDPEKAWEYIVRSLTEEQARIAIHKLHGKSGLEIAALERMNLQRVNALTAQCIYIFRSILSSPVPSSAALQVTQEISGYAGADKDIRHTFSFIVSQ